MEMLISAIVDFDKMWWGVCQGILKIIEAIGEAFNFLIGASDVKAEGGAQQNVNNVFLEIFVDGSNGD